MDAYSVLTNLPGITEVSDGSENTFLMFTNYTAHSSCLLQEPDYVPVMNVDNTAYDVDMVSRYTLDGKTMDMSDPRQVMLYHVNMASFIKLGEWFDYLRENGVYDNTRIIIVADHGFDVNQFDITCNGQDLEYFMPLLMVKDFNATGFTTSSEFMTNGDTPAIATEGLIDNPYNPFTLNPITYDGKQGTQTIFYCEKWDPEDNPGNTFQPGSWYTFLGGDPHDASNWEYLGDY
jgi:arylsulfatase A-like enzyme